MAESRYAEIASSRCTQQMREAPMPAYLYLYVNDTDATYCW